MAINEEQGLQLTYRDIELAVEVTEAELLAVFKLLNDPGVAHLIRGNMVLRSSASFAGTFQDWERSDIGHRFFVRHRTSGCIGFVWEYQRSTQEGHTRLSVVLRKEVIGRGYGAIAAALFCRWIFTCVRVDGIILEVYEYNEAVVKGLRKLSRYIGHDVQEDILRKYKYWSGRQQKMHYFRIEREDWPAVEAKILRHQSCNRRQAVAKGKTAGQTDAGSSKACHMES